MEKDEALDPIDVGRLRPATVMLQAERTTHLVSSFGRPEPSIFSKLPLAADQPFSHSAIVRQEIDCTLQPNPR